MDTAKTFLSLLADSVSKMFCSKTVLLLRWYFSFIHPSRSSRNIYLSAFRFISSKRVSHVSVVWDFSTTRNVFRMLGIIMLSISSERIHLFICSLFINKHFLIRYLSNLANISWLYVNMFFYHV